MTAKIISGKILSEQLLEQQIQEAKKLAAKGIRPSLAVVLIGNDPASAIYVRNKERACDTIGIESKSYRLPEDVKQNDVLDLICKLNNDPSIHGILVQLPLPNILTRL